MNLLKCVVAILLITFTYKVEAQQAYTLKQAQSFALENAYNLQKAKAEVDRAQSVVKETTAIGLPQVNASGRFSQFIDIPVQVVPAEFFGGAPGELAEVQFGTDYSMNAAISASQLIFDGSYIVGLQAARTYNLLAKQSLEKVQADIKEMVAQAYYAVIILEESKILLGSTIENTEKLLEEQRAYFEQGLLDETDVDQLELQFQTLQNQLKSIERNAMISKNLLKFQMGLPLESEINLADNVETLTALDAEADFDGLNFNSKSNIGYKLSETNVNLQRLNFKNKRAGYLPSLAAFYNYELNAFRNNFDFFSNTNNYFPTNVWGLSLNVPIFTSGLKHQQVQQAKIAIKTAELDQKIAEEGLKLEYQQAMEKLKTAIENQALSKRSFELSEKILNRTQIKNKEGLASSLELTQIQNQFIQAQQAYLNATLDVFNSKATLNKLINN